VGYNFVADITGLPLLI